MKHIYITDDGNEFDNELDALDHEQSLKADPSILDISYEGTIGTTTIKDTLCMLLCSLITEGERFNSKRPLGSSGWQFDIYEVLIRSGKIKGELDEFGHVEVFNEKEATELICATITELFKNE
jgi:hypothetical protein